MVSFTLEQKYPELKYYYEELGGDRIKALGYKGKGTKKMKSVSDIQLKKSIMN